MTDKRDNINKNEVEMIELFHILAKRKWWFVGTFIAIILFGFLFTFLRTPQYNATSNLKMLNKYTYHSDFIQKILPEEAANLWLFPESADGYYENNQLDIAYKKIMSDDFVKKLLQKIDYDLSKDELIKINEVKRISDRTLTVVTIYSDPEITYEINKAVVELYIEEYRSILSDSFDNLLLEIDNKSANVLTEIDFLANKISGDESGIIKEEKDYYHSIYIDLIEIKNVLQENKDYFVNRLEKVKEIELLDVERYSSYKRDIIFTIFSAIIIGLLAAFIANFFINLKKNT